MPEQTDYSSVVKQITEEIELEMADGVLDDPQEFVRDKLVPLFNRLFANCPTLRQDEIDQAQKIANLGKQLKVTAEARDEWRRKFQEQVGLDDERVAEFAAAGQTPNEELQALVDSLRSRLKDVNSRAAKLKMRNKELGATIQELRERIPDGVADQVLRDIKSGKLAEDKRVAELRARRKKDASG